MHTGRLKRKLLWDQIDENKTDRCWQTGAETISHWRRMRTQYRKTTNVQRNKTTDRYVRRNQLNLRIWTNYRLTTLTLGAETGGKRDVNLSHTNICYCKQLTRGRRATNYYYHRHTLRYTNLEFRLYIRPSINRYHLKNGVWIMCSWSSWSARDSSIPAFKWGYELPTPSNSCQHVNQFKVSTSEWKFVTVAVKEL